MAQARGSQREIAFVEESTFGETPSSPTAKKLRTTGDTLALSKNSTTSSELRSDRQITDVRHGTRRVGGNISFELMFADLEAFMEAAMFATFQQAYSLTGLTVDVDATNKEFTRSSGSWIDDGVEVDDVVTFSGFTNTENNDSFVVTAVTDTVITCSNATGLVDETDATGIDVSTTAEVLKMGTSLKTFALEKAHTDITQYQLFNGVGVTTMELAMQVDSMITGSFGVVGSDLTLSGSRMDPDPTAPTSNSPFSTYEGDLKEGGSSIATLTSLNLTLENSLEPTYVLMNKAAQSLIDGRSNLTGSVSAYFEDATLIDKFINETETSLEVDVADPAGNKYRLTIPRLKYNGADNPVNGEGPIMLNMPFQALYDQAEGSNLVIRKLPAIS